MTGPRVDADTLHLTAARSTSVRVSVGGSGIARATALTPWGDRVALESDRQGAWHGDLVVPADQAPGTALITLVLLDGAHNRTEVSLELEIR